MKPVHQDRFYRPGDDPRGAARGNCVAACIASIFELPLDECREIGPDFSSLHSWVADRYPGIEAVNWEITGLDFESDRSLDEWERWSTDHFERGYWLASVYSPRIPSKEVRGCGCAKREVDGVYGDCDPDPNCKWCGGKPEERFLGILWGLHSVVMHGRSLAWDPHPDGGDSLHFRSATTFVVVDPAQLRHRDIG